MHYMLPAYLLRLFGRVLVAEGVVSLCEADLSLRGESRKQLVVL